MTEKTKKIVKYGLWGTLALSSIGLIVMYNVGVPEIVSFIEGVKSVIDVIAWLVVK